ncbi:hypothetical protein Daesc_003592 [Daldinia eschscholtzii]|uniref:DUF7918 domain-containing protein n=1 Tax=Daldinia eschscholtzii TaxID=292717 RepID=A0AAX6MTK2_9PEZI
MAILSEHPGLEVTVRVNGLTATEYDCSYDLESHVGEDFDEDTLCVKYIESSDDTMYYISLKVTQDYPWGYKDHCLHAVVFIDGQWVKAEYCHDINTDSGDWERYVNYRVTEDSRDNFVKQYFRFAPITAVEGDEQRYQEDRLRAQDIGIINVRIYRAIETGAIDNIPSHRRPVGADLELSSEAAQEYGITHGTRYSEPVQMLSTPSYGDCIHLPEDNGPIAEFYFVYRSREALISQGLMPRDPDSTPEYSSPSPSPTPSDGGSAEPAASRYRTYIDENGNEVVDLVDSDTDDHNNVDQVQAEVESEIDETDLDVIFAGIQEYYADDDKDPDYVDY